MTRAHSDAEGVSVPIQTEAASSVKPSHVQKNCLACDALISVRVADHKRGWGRFCDKSCKAAHGVGMRPRDVNAHHAKFSAWAKTCMALRAAMGVADQWPRAPRLKDQIGKVRVRPLYHSPASCRCGVRINGPGLCETCEAYEQGLWENEAGWDGHKGMA